MHRIELWLWPRYQKTGTPLPKELRDYVEEVNKTKAKVEPEQVGASEGSPDLDPASVYPRFERPCHSVKPH